MHHAQKSVQVIEHFFFQISNLLQISPFKTKIAVQCSYHHLFLFFVGVGGLYFFFGWGRDGKHKQQ